MPTYASVLKDIHANEVDGTEMVITTIDQATQDTVNHIVRTIADQEIATSTNVYIAGGSFAPGTVTRKQGRKEENLRLIRWLAFDADLKDYVGIPKEDLWHKSQDELDTLIDAQVTTLRTVFHDLGIRFHRIDYTGYGVCVYTYLQAEPNTRDEITTIKTACSALIEMINNRAGFELVDRQASDAGTRVNRLPHSFNVKNPSMPREVRTLWADYANPVPVDALRFLERKKPATPQAVPMVATSSLPASSANEIAQAVKPYWKTGQKHSTALALAGMLAKAGVKRSDALQLVAALSIDDEKPWDRTNCVNTTYDRLESGASVEGFYAMRDLLPDTVVSYVAERLDRVRNATYRGAKTEGFVTTIGDVPPIADPEDDAARLPDVLPLPDICLMGWLDDYVQLMGPLTEAPDSFHLATAMTVAGASIGRSISVYHVSQDFYPNLYVMVIGSAGKSRKDTAIKMGINLPRYRGWVTSANSAFQVIRDIGSPQGLMEVLSQHNNVLAYLTEYERLAQNAHRQSTPIFPLLTTAFDTPPVIQNVTKGSAMEAKLPFLSILSAVQPELLAEHMLPQDISNGFATRWLYVVGEPKDPMPSPPNLDENAAASLYGHLIGMISRIAGNAVSRAVRFELSPSARDRWDAWYIADYQNSDGNADEQSMRSRLGTHILKVALIYAVCDGATGSIELNHLNAAIAFVDWCWHHTRELMKDWGVGPTNQIENRIEAVLRRSRALKRRDLHNQCRNRKWNSADFAKVLDAMIRNGTVEIDEEGRLYLG